MDSSYENARRLSSLSAETRKSLQRLEADWSPDAPPIIHAMATIGRSLAHGLERISREEVKSILDLAEDLMKCSDEISQVAVATGFLEALLSEASAGYLDFRKIGPLLGEECRKYCQEWDRFTGLTTNGLG